MDNPGRFKKGQSGNPRGKPKSNHEHVRDLARAFTAKALETLVECLDSRNDRTRVAAAQALLDRGWGRPSEPRMAEDGKMVTLQLRKLEAETKLIEKRIEEGSPAGAEVFLPDSEAYREFLNREWGFSRTGNEAGDEQQSTSTPAIEADNKLA